MNKDLSRHIVVLDLVEFAIVLMDKIHVLGLDMLSECDQDGLSLLVFAVILLLSTSSCCINTSKALFASCIRSLIVMLPHTLLSRMISTFEFV